MGVFEVVGTEGVVIDASRLELDGVPFPDNPFFLDEEDRDGFVSNLTIRSQDNESLTTYIIAFFDEADELFQSEFTLDTRPQGNEVMTRVGVLFNSAGPAGFGGLDLDSGAGTGSTDPSAELRDSGIDNSLPLGENWLQTISGVNNTQVQYLIPGQNGLPGDFTFGSVATDLDIQEAATYGIDFTSNTANGLTSDPINEGDMFVANRDGQFYIFVIREVNVTSDNNNDNYMMDISF